MTEETAKNQKRKTRKIQVEWTEQKVNSLITAVESEPILWNASLPDYRNKIKRDSTWTTISECTFGNEIESTELNAKWQNLRCQYKDYSNKSKKKKSGQGADENYVIRWKYFDQMKFLESGDGTESMETTSNMSTLVSNLFINFVK